jgi:hypothetical protein
MIFARKNGDQYSFPNEEARVFAGNGAYAYVPGDVNMLNGQWRPQIIGGDVTYLVGYFRGLNPPCMIGNPGLFAAADVNGDCQVIGSDVTRLVTYFRSPIYLSYCPDYPPLWLRPNETPMEAPVGWPGCQ